MGIPSYFSYIVKNHPEILERFIKGVIIVDNLYMDSNSIIYDSFYTLSDEEKGNKDIAKLIIEKVIKKIEEYITIIEPRKCVYISFDGVAPRAKLDQQRQRRFKSAFQSTITSKLYEKNDTPWSTASITPGTSFMKKLNSEIKAHFHNKFDKKDRNIIVSTSDDPGEGEHKLFQYIRENSNHSEETTVIYGLDADLIMLSINHIPVCKKIYLFRETPEFIKSVDSSLEPNDNYLLDIPSLASNIVDEMHTVISSNNSYVNKRLYDYIFICFFLGNDFMPHFPALNIRTGGIDKLLNHYKETIGKTNSFLVEKENINWKSLRKLIESLSTCEKEYIQKEYRKRNSMEKGFSHRDISTPELKLDKFQQIPCYERDNEHYINPDSEGWEYRYYKTLFNCEPTRERIRQICLNYFEGLEWTLKYYQNSCADWNWVYKYQYPPLLCDLLKHIPSFETTFIHPNKNKPIDPITQLCYVLPRNCLSLLPYRIYQKLQKNYQHLYPESCYFEWSYCKYFWECHALLPEISINEIEQII